MISFLLALALAPWTHPLRFGPIAGWHSGASGNAPSLYGTVGKPESTAWTATNNVHYRDNATADPPNRTLAHLPASGLIVWAVIYAPVENGQRPLRLDLRNARHLACCDGPVRVAGGDLELTGYGPGHAYSVIVRVYFGSALTTALRTKAQAALNHLRLPQP